jgi:2-polyprenyl-3-methyl-5-hydroxy-6-metoxy-1,4-benzoquinol methylase
MEEWINHPQPNEELLLEFASHLSLLMLIANMSATMLNVNILNANHVLVQILCKPTKKVSIFLKKHECISKLTTSIYKISWSNSSYSSSYKKAKFW